MKQFKKRKTVVIGLVGIVVTTVFFSLNSESIFFRAVDLPAFFSAIFFFSWVLITSKFAKSAWYQNPLFLILLILTTFFIPLSNQNRWVLLFLLSACALLLHYKELDVSRFLAATLRISGFLLLAKLLTAILSKVPDYILQFLSFGYDNAFHFAIYRYYRAEPWFPFGTQKTWGTDFELFRTYPSGQAAFWSFLAEPIIGDNLDSEKNLVVYGVLNLLVLIAANWLIFRSIRQYSQKKYEDVVFTGVASFVISIGYFGIFLTNGFIPYAAGILILLIYHLVLSSNLDRTSRYLTVFLSTLLLLLISPALIAFLFFPGIISSIKYFKEAISSASYMRIGIILTASTALALVGYFFQFITSSNFGWRLILEPGGVIKPNLYVAFFLFLSIVFILALRRKSIIDNLVIQLVLSGAFSVAVLSAITIIFTGSIQYYAAKQLHVWLVLAALCVAAALTSLKGVAIKVSSLKVTFIFLLILPLMTSTSIRSGWMGNMIGVISSTVDKSNWEFQIVKVANIRSGLEVVNTGENVSTECLILRSEGSESDLNSRWINALNIEPSITNNCFAAFWNSTTLSREEFELRLKDLEGNFLVLTDVNGKSSVRENSNFQYVHIYGGK